MPALSLHWHEVPHGISFSTPIQRDGAKRQELHRHFRQCSFKQGGVGKRDRWTANGEERADDLFPWLMTRFDVVNTGKPTEGTLEAHRKAKAATARSRNPDGEATPTPEPEATTAAEFEAAQRDMFRPSP